MSHASDMFEGEAKTRTKKLEIGTMGIYIKKCATWKEIGTMGI
jgi:hypothetical protein